MSIGRPTNLDLLQPHEIITPASDSELKTDLELFINGVHSGQNSLLSRALNHGKPARAITDFIVSAGLTEFKIDRDTSTNLSTHLVESKLARESLNQELKHPTRILKAEKDKTDEEKKQSESYQSGYPSYDSIFDEYGNIRAELLDFFPENIRARLSQTLSILYSLAYRAIWTNRTFQPWLRSLGFLGGSLPDQKLAEVKPPKPSDSKETTSISHISPLEVLKEKFPQLDLLTAAERLRGSGAVKESLIGGIMQCLAGEFKAKSDTPGSAFLGGMILTLVTQQSNSISEPRDRLDNLRKLILAKQNELSPDLLTKLNSIYETCEIYLDSIISSPKNFHQLFQLGCTIDDIVTEFHKTQSMDKCKQALDHFEMILKCKIELNKLRLQSNQETNFHRLWAQLNSLERNNQFPHIKAMLSNLYRRNAQANKDPQYQDFIYLPTDKALVINGFAHGLLAHEEKKRSAENFLKQARFGSAVSSLVTNPSLYPAVDCKEVQQREFKDKFDRHPDESPFDEEGLLQPWILAWFPVSTHSALTPLFKQFWSTAYPAAAQQDSAFYQQLHGFLNVPDEKHGIKSLLAEAESRKSIEATEAILSAITLLFKESLDLERAPVFCSMALKIIDRQSQLMTDARGNLNRLKELKGTQTLHESFERWFETIKSEPIHFHQLPQLIELSNQAYGVDKFRLEFIQYQVDCLHQFNLLRSLRTQFKEIPELYEQLYSVFESIVRLSYVKEIPELSELANLHQLLLTLVGDIRRSRPHSHITDIIHHTASEACRIALRCTAIPGPIEDINRTANEVVYKPGLEFFDKLNAKKDIKGIQNLTKGLTAAIDVIQDSINPAKANKLCDVANNVHGKGSLWKKVAGGLLMLGGAALIIVSSVMSIPSFGLSIPYTLIGAGIFVAGMALFTSGIQRGYSKNLSLFGQYAKDVTKVINTTPQKGKEQEHKTEAKAGEQEPLIRSGSSPSA